MIEDLSIYNIYSLDCLINFVECITKFILDVLLGSNHDLYSCSIEYTLSASTVLFMIDGLINMLNE